MKKMKKYSFSFKILSFFCFHVESSDILKDHILIACFFEDYLILSYLFSFPIKITIILLGVIRKYYIQEIRWLECTKLVKIVRFVSLNKMNRVGLVYSHLFFIDLLLIFLNTSLFAIIHILINFLFIYFMFV